MTLKEGSSIKDCNYAFPLFCKTAAGTDFVQMNISFTLTKEAYELLTDYGYDFYMNAKEEAKEAYFELQRCMFDAKDDDVIE